MTVEVIAPEGAPAIHGLDSPHRFYQVLQAPAPLAGMSFPDCAPWNAMATAGFDSVVCLTTDAPQYDPSPLRRLLTVEFQDLYGGAHPDDPQREAGMLRDVVEAVVCELRSGRGVVVHCAGGTGRTGTVIACTLAALGMTEAEVLEYMTTVNAARGQSCGWPESDWQKSQVAAFVPCTAPDVLLLPGLLSDARLWQDQVAGLSAVARVTVADLTGADTMPALAASALRQAPAGRFVVAGLSMGGYVALELLRQAPERVAGLALLDTSARPDTAEATEARKSMMQLAESDFPAVIDTLLPRLVRPASLSDAPLVATIREMAASVGKEAFLRQERAMIARIDSRPFLDRIRCPALVLCGRDDVITPPEVHQELHAGIPGASLTVVDDSGHLSTLEQPRRVTDALSELLARVRSERA
jgi:pimeloyl-ACP methyl ester carboxylesterase